VRAALLLDTNSAFFIRVYKFFKTPITSTRSPIYKAFFTQRFWLQTINFFFFFGSFIYSHKLLQLLLFEFNTENSDKYLELDNDKKKRFLQPKSLHTSYDVVISSQAQIFFSSENLKSYFLFTFDWNKCCRSMRSSNNSHNVLFSVVSVN